MIISPKTPNENKTKTQRKYNENKTKTQHFIVFGQKNKLNQSFLTVFFSNFEDLHMNGQELRYFLKRSGIAYADFAGQIGKSTGTIQRWVSDNCRIGEIYVGVLRFIITPRAFVKIEKEYEELMIQKGRREPKVSETK